MVNLSSSTSTQWPSCSDSDICPCAQISTAWHDTHIRLGNSITRKTEAASRRGAAMPIRVVVIRCEYNEAMAGEGREAAMLIGIQIMR